jgi:DNA primase
LRLEEAGIHNSVAIFGSSLSDSQQFLLERLGVMSLSVCLDNDEAGKKGRDQILRDCRSMYNLSFPEFSKNDIAELSAKEIKEIEW